MHYCELFPSHSTAVSENNVHTRLVTALTPKRGSGSEVKQVSCENLCLTLLVDLSPFTTVAVNKHHARSLPQSTLFNLPVMSSQLLEYYAIYI